MVRSSNSSWLHSERRRGWQQAAITTTTMKFVTIRTRITMHLLDPHTHDMHLPYCALCGWLLLVIDYKQEMLFGIIVSYFRKQLNCSQDYPRLTGIDSKALVTGWPWLDCTTYASHVSWAYIKENPHQGQKKEEIYICIYLVDQCQHLWHCCQHLWQWGSHNSIYFRCALNIYGTARVTTPSALCECPILMANSLIDYVW